MFDYERKFIRSGLDISPIIMPISQYRNTPYRFLENRTDCFKGLPGLFADSLPDTFGNQIINEWFASKGLSGEEITPLDRLCYVGKRGMGALEFEPSSPINGMNESSVLHIEELTEQYVLQQMKSKGVSPIYYHNTDNSRLELDFVIQRNAQMVPIEVKAEGNVRANSLTALLGKRPELHAERFSMLPYKVQGNLTNFPLYAI